MTEVNLSDLPPDPEIDGQKWIVVSYAPHPENNLIYFKFRGAYFDSGQAFQRAQYLHNVDEPKIPIYVAPIGVFVEAHIDMNNLIDLNKPKTTLTQVPFNIISEGPPENNEETNTTTNINISKDLLCLACYEEKRNMMFSPCRHISFCSICIKEHVKFSNECPICRSQVKEVMNVFLS